MILSVCNVPEVLKIMKIVKVVILILKIAVPIILIVLAMLDFARAVVSKDNDSLSQSIKIATKRFITAAIIFLLPTAVNIIFNVIAPNISYKDCFDNATDEKIEAIYQETMSNLVTEAESKKDYTSVSAARSYLKNIENEELYNQYTKTLDKIEKEADEEAERQRQAQTKSGTYYAGGASSNWGEPIDNSTFLTTADGVWKKITAGNKYFSYCDNPGQAIPIPETTYCRKPEATNVSVCNCSSYVSWVIYEYGYTDFKGWQKTTWGMFGANYNELYGWQEKYFSGGVDLKPYLKPGDIVVRFIEQNGVKKGHVEIVVSVSDKGAVAYSCGSSPAVKNGSHVNGVPTTFFDATDDRPAKIIRVTPKNYSSSGSAASTTSGGAGKDNKIMEVK